jgi:catechol 2,3-dioxygenase-like lactoylglutathione lyase family enzyme
MAAPVEIDPHILTSVDLMLGCEQIDTDRCTLPEEAMSRLQLALNVTDLEAAVDFYSRLFATEPAKRKPGYANYEIADPPLKLVLFEGPEGGTINHLGVETDTPDEVLAAESRLTGTGLATTGVDDTVCCYATKVETWVTDPDGARWEWYVKTGDTDQLSYELLDDGAVCCAPPAAEPEPVSLGRRSGGRDSDTPTGCC